MRDFYNPKINPDEINFDTAKAVINSAVNGLNELCSSLDKNFKAALLEIMKIKGRVILSGMGKSGHIAKKIAATFASTGTPAFFIHPGEASHGDLGMIQPDDLVILLSNSGETKELSDIINYCKRFHIFIVAIACNPGSALALAANIALILPKMPEALNFDAPTTSSTMMLVLGDAIALSLLDLKGFSRDDFQIFHPGGRLGTTFFKVKDIMHVDYELPIVHENDSVAHTIEVITLKKFGCAAVLNNEQKLVGIFTDGELRRNTHLPKLLEVKIKQIMKPSPVTISAESLVLEALEKLNRHRITSLLVTDEQQLLKGIVHIHDCLKIGATPEMSFKNNE